MDMHSLELCSCFAVRQAARQITRIYDRQLAGTELTATQFTLLALLHDNPDATMRELSEALVMDRTALLRALKPLQEQELVDSARSSTDPRQLVLALTAAGRKRLQAALPLWRAAQHEFESQMGAGRTRVLRSALLEVARIQAA